MGFDLSSSQEFAPPPVVPPVIPPVENNFTEPSRPTTYDSLINTIAAKYNVDPSLVHGVIHTESSYDPNAVSDKGARGLMQLMPGTAKELGVVDPHNPEQNLDGGIKYLSNLIKGYGGDTKKALAAYNWGPGNVAHAGEIPQSVQDYQNKVLDAQALYNKDNSTSQPSPQATKTGFDLSSAQPFDLGSATAVGAEAPQPQGNTLSTIAKNAIKEPFGIAGQIAGGLADSLYTGAAGIAGLSKLATSTLSGKPDPLGDAANTINAMRGAEPHPFDKYFPESKLFNAIDQNIVQPVVKGVGDVTGHPEIVNPVVEAAGKIAALAPLSPGFGKVANAAGDYVGKSLGNSADVARGAIKDAASKVSSGVGDAAKFASDQSGLTGLVNGIKATLAPATEDIIAQKLVKPVEKLGGMPSKFATSTDSRNAYMSRVALATDENLQQAGRAGIDPKAYKDGLTVKDELYNTGKSKQALFKEYDSALQDASVSGATVSIKPLISFWEDQLNRRVNKEAGLAPLKVAEGDAVKSPTFIQQRINYLKSLGDYSLKDAQDKIQAFNSKFDPSKMPQNEYQAAGLAAKEISILRDSLNDSVDNLPSTLTYQGLKDRYGALSQHEELFSRAVQKQLKQNAASTGSFLDYIAGAEGIRGLTTMNPHTLVMAAATEGLASWKRLTRNMDRATRSMYDIRGSKWSPREFYQAPEAGPAPTPGPEFQAPQSPTLPPFNPVITNQQPGLGYRPEFPDQASTPDFAKPKSTNVAGLLEDRGPEFWRWFHGMDDAPQKGSFDYSKLQ